MIRYITSGLFEGLSHEALQASIQYLNSVILAQDPNIGEAANHAYKVYSKAFNLEQFALGTKLKKITRLQFQSMVDPEAQSIWAYGDKCHGYIFK